jgi:hypothetical protein
MHERTKSAHFNAGRERNECVEITNKQTTSTVASPDRFVFSS